MATTIASKNFILDTASDIHMTFSACCQITAAMTISAETELIEGTSSTTMPFQPKWALSSSSTLIYYENFQAISAGSTTITVKLQNSTGTMTVNSGQCSLNIITFPNSVTASVAENNTASDTAWSTFVTKKTVTISAGVFILTSSITYTGEMITPSRFNSMVIDDANNLYVATKYSLDGNYFMVYKSSDEGDSWTNSKLPVETGSYTVGITSILNATLSYNNDAIQVAYCTLTGSLTDHYMMTCFNYIDSASVTNIWTLTSTLTISAVETHNEPAEIGSNIITDKIGRHHYFSSQIDSLKGLCWFTSTDNFDTRSEGSWPFSRYQRYPKLLLDNDGVSIHCICSQTNTGQVVYRKFDGTSWMTSSLYICTSNATNAYNNKAIAQDRNDTLYAAIYNNSSEFEVTKKTAGMTTWSTIDKLAVASANSMDMFLDPYYNPVLTYSKINSSSATQIYYSKYNLTSSAWESAVAISPLDADDTVMINPHVMFVRSAGLTSGLHMAFLSGISADGTGLHNKIGYYYQSYV